MVAVPALGCFCEGQVGNAVDVEKIGEVPDVENGSVSEGKFHDLVKLNGGSQARGVWVCCAGGIIRNGPAFRVDIKDGAVIGGEAVVSVDLKIGGNWPVFDCFTEKIEFCKAGWKAK